MPITADALVSYMAGAAAVGSLVTFVLMRRKRVVISMADRLAEEIHRSIDTLASFCDLTDVQRKQIIGLQTLAGSNRRLASLDEIFGYYLWAEGNGLDPVPGSALAIICERCLGLTRQDAKRAMSQAKRADDYKTLLPSRNRSPLRIVR